MKYNLFLSLILVTGAPVVFGCSNEQYSMQEFTKSSVWEIKDPRSEKRDQGSGIIHFCLQRTNTNNPSSAALATKIIGLCCEMHTEFNPEKLEEAKSLLTQIPQETTEQQLHHCVALMTIGESYCFSYKDRDKAKDYLNQVVEKYKFTGAMARLGVLANQDDKFEDSFAWLLQAKENGYSVSDDKITELERLLIKEREQVIKR